MAAQTESSRGSVVFLFFSLTALFVANLLTLWLDPPYIVATWSGVFLTDEGFHTKAAQDLVRFGSWAAPYDTDFRLAAPLFNLIAYLLFAIFDVDLAVGRVYTLVVSTITALAFYGLCRTKFSGWLSVALTVASVTTLNVLAYSRLFLIDPTGTCLATSAAYVYARYGHATWAMAPSLLLAFCAFFTKAHYLTIVVALVLVWSLEIAERARDPVQHARGAVSLMVGLLALFGLAVAALSATFAEEAPLFYETVTSGKIGGFDVGAVLGKELRMLRNLLYNTKAPVFLLAIAAALAYGAFRCIRAGGSVVATIIGFLSSLGRAERISIAWLLVGLPMVGALQNQPPRYFLFAILPICFLGAAAVWRATPDSRRGILTAGLIGIHMLSQAPLYYYWLKRDPNHTQIAMAERAVDIIHAETGGEVAVIGQLGAWIGLFSPRIRGLDVAYVPKSFYSLCDRVERWRPTFIFDAEKWIELYDVPGQITQCPSVSSLTEVERIPVARGWQGDVLLIRIRYTTP